MDVFWFRESIEKKDSNLHKLRKLVSSTWWKISLTIWGAAFIFHYLKLNFIEGSQYEKLFERIELVSYPLSLTFIWFLLTYFNYKLDLEKQKNFHQKQDMERILNSIPWSILYRDKDWFYRRCSRYFYEKFWLTSVDIVWKTPEIISKWDVSIPHINWERTWLERQILWWGIEYEVKTVDGLNDNYTLIRELPLVLDDWSFNWTVIFGFDITRERLLQRQLEISKNFIKEKLHFLQELIDTLPNPLFFKSISWVVPNQYKFYNKAFCETLWINDDPNTVISMWDVICNEECMNLHIWKDAILLAWTSDTIIYEYDVLHKWSNSLRNYLITKKLMVDSNWDIIWILWILTDRTERKKLLEAKDSADSILRHEIRSIGNTIHYGISMLEQNMMSTQEFLKIAKPTMKRFFQQINLLSDIVNIEEWKYLVENIKFNFVSILREIFFEFTLKNNTVPIKFYIDWNLIDLHLDMDFSNFDMIWDEKLIYMIVVNILKNAIEASEDSKNLKRDVSIHFTTDTKYLNLSVYNAGVIPEEIRDNFFDKFVTSWKRFWTWLGTYIIKKFTEYLWGKISFETCEKKWTTMFLELPLNSNKSN